MCWHGARQTTRRRRPSGRARRAGSRSCSNPNPNPNPSPNPNLSLKLSLAYTHHPYHLSILTFYAFISQELLYGLFCPCCDTIICEAIDHRAQKKARAAAAANGALGLEMQRP